MRMLRHMGRRSGVDLVLLDSRGGTKCPAAKPIAPSSGDLDGFRG